jgi:hypothetical protein
VPGTYTATEALVTGGTALGGVVVGWALNAISARRARDDQRAQLRAERIIQRQDETAAIMDAALVDAARRVPHVFSDATETAVELNDVHAEWQRGWVRSTLINDAELTDRYAVVGSMCFNLVQDLHLGSGVQIIFLTRAITNARRSLAAFRREEELPAATFPGRDLLRELLGHPLHAGRYERLADWISEHPEPATG